MCRAEEVKREIDREKNMEADGGGRPHLVRRALWGLLLSTDGRVKVRSKVNKASPTHTDASTPQFSKKSTPSSECCVCVSRLERLRADNGSDYMWKPTRKIKQNILKTWKLEGEFFMVQVQQLSTGLSRIRRKYVKQTWKRQEVQDEAESLTRISHHVLKKVLNI